MQTKFTQWLSSNPHKNSAKIVKGGKEYFDYLIQLIDRACKSIHLQTYIFDDDITGKKVAEALKEAAKKNIEVYIMVDGYASQVLSQTFINDLRAHGIRFKFFEPFFKSKNFYFGRRLHHKIVVVDAKYALVGGINISDKYNDFPYQKAWLDFAVYVEGDLAVELCTLCCKTWNNFSSKIVLDNCIQNGIVQFNKNNDNCEIVMKRNDWVRRKNEISSSYIEMFKNANSHITIICSYFIPGKVIRRLIQNAAKRNIKISIITAGPSDVLVSKYAERWLYDWLLRKNIAIYEYQKNILHAKVAVCDGEWATIGSYNINNLSAYASIELNLNITSKKIATDMEQTIETIKINDCKKITTEVWSLNKNIFNQFIHWCSYQFIRLTFTLMTFYYKQEKITLKK